MATVKVKAHTRKDGTKVKAYSYTRGSKKKTRLDTLKKGTKRVLKKGPSRKTFDKVTKLRQRMYDALSRRPRLKRSKA